MKAKKRLGQNFLIDNNIISKIVDEVAATKKDLIIEIGPGRGALTKELIKKDANLICYEVDKDLISTLELLENKKTKIIYKDILKADISEDIKDIKYDKLYIVGNLPYYITTPIIEHIIDLNINFSKLTIMVQKEVADRFLAKPKTKEYGYMTLVIDYYFDAKRVCNVSKNSFMPAPKVESTVLSLNKKSNNYNVYEKDYFDFLKKCFSQKRKTLKNNLKEYSWNGIKNVLKEHGYSENSRAEELTQDILVKIFKAII